jgi:hypothetical protein
LHEGGADALTWRALRELKVIDEAHFWREQSESVSKCLLGLQSQPLRESSRPGEFKNYYHCGAAMNLLTEAVLRAAKSKDDLYTFWRGVFTTRGDGSYDDQAFFKALLGVTGSEPTVALLKQMVNGPTANIESLLRSELQRLQLNTEVVSAPEDREYQRTAGARAARAVITYDCGEKTRLEGQGVFQVPGSAKCKKLTPALAISHIGSFSIHKNGSSAYDHVVSTCASSGRVHVGDERGSVEVACGEPTLPKRPAYLRVTGYMKDSPEKNARQ